MTGHSPRVYDEHYAKPFRDAEERDRIRASLASVGGSVTGDQSVDQRAVSASLLPLSKRKGRICGPFSWSVPAPTGDPRLAKLVLSQLS